VIRTRLRKWLGINALDQDVDGLRRNYSMLGDDIVALGTRIDIVGGELEAFKSALKAKAQQMPARVAPFDYESSQVAALEQFKEK